MASETRNLLNIDRVCIRVYILNKRLKKKHLTVEKVSYYDVVKNSKPWRLSQEVDWCWRDSIVSIFIKIFKVNSQQTKKHGVSWNDAQYQRNIVLQDLGTKSQDWFLERKASVGPCFRPGMPFEGPSGIMICVPKKSARCISAPSGININVSRKCLVCKDVMIHPDKRYKLAMPDNKMDSEIAYAKIYNTLKEKVISVRSKIKCVFNI